MKRPRARILVAALPFLLFAPRTAGSSCNSMPEVDSNAPSDGSGPKLLGYKGALGRIDRAFFVSGTSASVVVTPDGTCVAHPTPSAAGKLLDPVGEPKDLVVMLVLPAPDGSKTAVRVWAADDVCKSLLAPADGAAGAAAKRDGRATVDFMKTCSLGGVETVSTEKKLETAGLRNALKVTLPSPDELQAAVGSSGALLTPRIIVARKPEGSGAAIGTLLQEAAGKTCAAGCNGSGLQMLACIDDLYAMSKNKLGQQVFTKDPVPCSVGLVVGPPLDVATVCESDEAPGPDRPNCPPTGSELPDLSMWLDKCGGVHVPLLWRNIRPAGINPAVFGRSGIGRGPKPFKDPPVRLPGREFFGTTPASDPGGDLPTTDWRRPDIDLWLQTGKDQDFGLKGVVDQDDSIIHIFPQLPVSLVCEDTPGHENACLGVERQSDGKFGVECACEDRQQPGCSCTTLATTARFFVCDANSGKSEGMPCTRDRHCNPGGSCNAAPHCQPPGTVWSEKKDDGNFECRVSADCPPPGHPELGQCGYRLFDLREAIDTAGGGGDNPTGEIKLDFKIKTVGHKRRGLCDDGTPCGNESGLGGPGACSAGECRGRKLKVVLPK